MLFDTHAHIYMNPICENLDENLKEYKKNDLSYVMLPAVEYSSWKPVIDIVNSYDNVYGAIGIHPNEVADTNIKVLDEIQNILDNNKKIRAIGEIGLDYYRSSNKDEQIIWLKKQLEIAKKNNITVIIHDREAHADVMNLLDEVDSYETGVILHCYSGSVEMALEYVKKGAYISLGGPVTFKNAKVPKDVANAVPLDRLLIETDSPFLTPEPFRGKTNNPSNVRFVAMKIASLKGISYEEVANKTRENAMRVFKI